MSLPVDRPGKIIAVGLNYSDHAAESAVPPPPAPVTFTKFPNCLIGDGEDIVIPAGVDQVDWEAELAVVIGRTAKDVPLEDALSYVSGYTCMNDVSARRIQAAEGQWSRAKSFDTFGPIGPRVVPASEIGDPQNLEVIARVNGTELQHANTKDMIFGVAELISRLSQGLTLEPGDIITTGTPSGVGAFRNPPIFLADGDVVEIEISGIGVLTNRVRADG